MFVILPYEMFLFFFCVLYKFVNTSQRVYMIILHDVFLMVAVLDMNFAFEVNENAVRHYIKKLRRSSQELNSFKFDLKPDRNP